MNGYQVYNLAWVIIWALLAIGGVYGILMGNLAHIGTVTASVVLGGMIFCDSEDGESLKDLIVRVIKHHTEGK